MSPDLIVHKQEAQSPEERLLAERVSQPPVKSIPQCTAPERLRGFVRLCLKNISEKTSGVSLHSTLDKETFTILYSDFIHEDDLPPLDPAIDPYVLFSEALLGVSEDWTIDFTRIVEHIPDMDHRLIQQAFRSQIGPLVVLWMEELRLEIIRWRASERFPQDNLEGSAIIVPLMATITGIRRELSQQVTTTFKLPTSVDVWLYALAGDPDLSVTATELRGKPCRLLLDAVDEELRGCSDISGPKITPLFRLFVAITRNSGDFPSRLWLDRSSHKGPLYTQMASMSMCHVTLESVPLTVCVPIEPMPGVFPTEVWEYRQNLFESIAVASQLSHRHPALLPLLGIFWDPVAQVLCTVYPFIPTVPRNFPYGSSKVLENRSKFRLMLQIIEGVQFLHENGIVHSDIHWVTTLQC
ncbi:hypothetical protein DL93DRAFT_2103434 [Clavulina sp. PMI_390]|nr:hypothetical protein DL93DRAFT_2103434 [Clavulina sp. PMI_390]